MPAERFTKKANTPRKKRAWNSVYEGCKEKGGEAGSCIRQASGVVKKMSRSKNK